MLLPSYPDKMDPPDPEGSPKHHLQNRFRFRFLEHNIISTEP
jgi:hypothetical protein